MKQMYSEGKIVFTSRLHARQIQYQLKQAGFEYETGSQRIRPGAYGIMWSNEFKGKHKKKKNMCTAGNEQVFKRYNAHRKQSIYTEETTRKVNGNTGRTGTLLSAQKAQEKTTAIVFSIFDYMEGLGYDFTAPRKGKRAQIRDGVWQAFMHLLLDQIKDPVYKQVKTAIRAKYRTPEAVDYYTAPDKVNLRNQYAAMPRPTGLKRMVPVVIG